MTARWVVERVAPDRQLEIQWEPFSLFFKNEPDPAARGYPSYLRTHSLLRVLESVRTDRGNDGVFLGYQAFGVRIHHDRALLDFDVESALRDTGLDGRHAAAADEPAWDEGIRARMAVGLELAGNDIGTPIIGFDNADGERVGIFGPVITRVPDSPRSLELWDGLVSVMSVPGFWELKRTRTERPEFGERPDV